ncbi:D-sedoheptulose 7-phosphate isomerase [Desulfovibrio sp. OttesenSCG-928-I05]|nr:D-sedoheptulose 7-phosphate isomerase [Desulfovibrio sp. OttesenSCG-928-I05]
MSEEARERVRQHVEAGLRAREAFFAAHTDTVIEAARAIAVNLARGGKVLLCGNGGSAADAQHLAGEFINRFKIDRPPLAAIALSTDSSVMTAIGNDFSFDDIFSKQVQALGRPGDVLIGISTSGGSANVLRAMEAARAAGVMTIGLTGRDGGAIARLSDISLNVSAQITAVVQEVHIAIGHLLCELADYYLFENALALAPYLEGAQE